MSMLLSVASSGLAAAGLRFEAAARSVAGIEPVQRADPPHQAAGSGVADRSILPAGAPAPELPYLEAGLADLKHAAAGYKAQIAVLQAADRQQKALLEIVA